jgi:hypothetical protein
MGKIALGGSVGALDRRAADLVGTRGIGGIIPGP